MMLILTQNECVETAALGRGIVIGRYPQMSVSPRLFGAWQQAARFGQIFDSWQRAHRAPGRFYSWRSHGDVCEARVDAVARFDRQGAASHLDGAAASRRPERDVRVVADRPAHTHLEGVG